MDRRRFIKLGTAAVAATAVSGTSVINASENLSSRRKDIKAGAPASGYSSETGKPSGKDLLVRFLGTGAADWNGVDERGEHRRLSSVLLDERILIDFTPTDSDMLPRGFSRPDAVFYTHSHDDHYNPDAAASILKAGKIYVGDTWLDRAKSELTAAAEKAGRKAPSVTGLAIGQKVNVGDIAVTALPGNHATGYADEQTLIYLIEKGDVRVLYATDTGGIPVRAARIVGIDAHISSGKPISGLIMEATMGIDYDEDYRIFTHSSVGTVKRTADVLLSTNRLVAPAGQPVYLTHMARTLHGTQAEMDRQLPEPLRAAFDGLEVIFRPA